LGAPSWLAVSGQPLMLEASIPLYRNGFFFENIFVHSY
jgi:hypothetical protein